MQDASGAKEQPVNLTPQESSHPSKASEVHGHEHGQVPHVHHNEAKTNELTQVEKLRLKILEEKAASKLQELEEKRHNEEKQQVLAQMQAQEGDSKEVLGHTGKSNAEAAGARNWPIDSINVNPHNEPLKTGILRKFFNSPPGKLLKPAITGMAASLLSACAAQDALYIGGKFSGDVLSHTANTQHRQRLGRNQDDYQANIDTSNAEYSEKINDLNFKYELNQLALDHNFALEKAKEESKRTGKPLQFDEAYWQRRRDEIRLKYGYIKDKGQLDKEALEERRAIDRTQQQERLEIDRQKGYQDAGIRAIHGGINSGINRGIEFLEKHFPKILGR